MHTHSTASDGTLTPSELAALASRKHLSVIALTDHDTVSGIPEFISACKKRSINCITGIELSALAPVTTHILGYRLRDMDKMARAMEWILEKREERNAAVVVKLQELGLDITLDEIKAEAKGNIVARPHFAKVLLRKGYITTYREAFTKYLMKGRPAYVARQSYSPKESIELIISAGGLPVLAHPSLMNLSDEDLDARLDEFKSYGLWGLECFSSHCTSESAYNFMRVADRHGLQPTGGSDFHGTSKPGVSLGITVEEDFMPWGRLGVSL